MRRVDLERLKELKKQSSELDERLRRLYEQATRTTALLDGLPRGSAMRSKVENSIVKIQSTIEETRADIVEQVMLEGEFTEAVRELAVMERRVLTMRYVDVRGYRQIANELGRSLDYVFKIHRRALKKILGEGSKRQ